MVTQKFNLEMFKNGAKAQTKLGNPARFLRVTNDGRLIVAVQPRFTPEEAVKYHLDGKKYRTIDTAYDLEMVKPYEVKA